MVAHARVLQQAPALKWIIKATRGTSDASVGGLTPPEMNLLRRPVRLGACITSLIFLSNAPVHLVQDVGTKALAPGPALPRLSLRCLTCSDPFRFQPPFVATFARKMACSQTLYRSASPYSYPDVWVNRCSSRALRLPLPPGRSRSDLLNRERRNLQLSLSSYR